MKAHGYHVRGGFGMGSTELWDGDKLVALFSLPAIKFDPKDANKRAEHICKLLKDEELTKLLRKMRKK